MMTLNILVASGRGRLSSKGKRGHSP